MNSAHGNKKGVSDYRGIKEEQCPTVYLVYCFGRTPRLPPRTPSASVFVCVCVLPDTYTICSIRMCAQIFRKKQNLWKAIESFPTNMNPVKYMGDEHT